MRETRSERATRIMADRARRRKRRWAFFLVPICLAILAKGALLHQWEKPAPQRSHYPEWRIASVPQCEPGYVLTIGGNEVRCALSTFTADVGITVTNGTTSVSRVTSGTGSVGTYYFETGTSYITPEGRKNAYYYPDTDVAQWIAMQAIYDGLYAPRKPKTTLKLSEEFCSSGCDDQPPKPTQEGKPNS